MPIDFYYLPPSPPCRAVQMTAIAVGAELNLKPMKLSDGEHLTPEYLEMNPQHSVPTINDDGFILWESRAIMIYLVEKYTKNNSLYPNDFRKRALINQRLFFDMGTLYLRMSEYYFPQIMAKQPAVPENYMKCEDAVAYLEKFLEKTEWAAGDTLTLADIALVATISTYDCVGFDVTKFPNVQRWYTKCKETIPGYDLNQAAIDDFKAKVLSN